MHPPADVEPARVRTFEHVLSPSILLKISAARAVSRLVKDILPMESMIGRASKLVMSMCSTGVESSWALRLDFDFALAMVGWSVRGESQGNKKGHRTRVTAGPVPGRKL